MAERHVVDPDGDCIFHIQQLPQSIKDKGHQNFHSKIIEPEKNDTETLAEISKISTEIQEVEFQVSSKHMSLASPTFKAIFLPTDGPKGDRKQEAKNTIHISLPDDNPNIFLILVKIIHYHNARLPELVSLSTLLHFAILVEKYQMHNAVKIVSNYWIHLLIDRVKSLKVHEHAVLHGFSNQIKYFYISLGYWF